MHQVVCATDFVGSVIDSGEQAVHFGGREHGRFDSIEPFPFGPRSMRTPLIAVFIVLILAGCATPRPSTESSEKSGSAPPYVLERFRDQAKIVEGVKVLEIDNPYGEIHVRQTTSSALAWQGVEQRIGSRPRVAEVHPFQRGDRQGVHIRYPGIDPRKPADPRKGRVDLYVFVPVGMLVDVRSDFGAIQVRRLRDDVKARSRSGLIVVTSRGAVDAESESGEIRLFAMQALGLTPTRAKTGGNIVADIPVFDDIEVDVRSGGEFRALFPGSRQTLLEGGVTQASWRNGTGSKRMSLDAGGWVTLQALDKAIP